MAEDDPFEGTPFEPATSDESEATYVDAPAAADDPELVAALKRAAEEISAGETRTEGPDRGR